MGALYDDWIEKLLALRSVSIFSTRKKIFVEDADFYHNGQYKFCPKCGKELK